MDGIILTESGANLAVIRNQALTQKREIHRMRTPRLPNRMLSGWLIALGFILFFSCVLILFRGDRELTLETVFSAVLVTTLGFLFLIGLEWLNSKLSPIGRGRRGKAIDTLDPEGRINLGGDTVQGKAIEGAPINPGEEIVVDRIKEKCFLVRRYVNKGDEKPRSK